MLESPPPAWKPVPFLLIILIGFGLQGIAEAQNRETITIRKGGDGYVDVEDAMLVPWGGGQGSYTGNKPHFDVGRNIGDTRAPLAITLMRFDFGSHDKIKAVGKILSAKLRLTVDHDFDQASRVRKVKLGVYTVPAKDSSWDASPESLVSGTYCCQSWLKIEKTAWSYKPEDWIEWKPPGLKFLGSANLSGIGVGDTVEIPLTEGWAVISDWIYGGVNGGIFLTDISKDSDASRVRFHSSEAADPGNRPQLVLEFSRLETTTVTLQEGGGGYSGTEDTSLIPWANAISRPQGEKNLIAVGDNTISADGPRKNATSLVRFDLSSLAGKMGTVTSAALSFHVADDLGKPGAKKTVLGVRELAVKAASWDEKKSTYKHLEKTVSWPAGSGLGAQGDPATKILGRTRYVDEVIEIPFSVPYNRLQFFKKWAEGEVNPGFLISDVSGDPGATWLRLWSKEAAEIKKRPQLILTFTGPDQVLDLPAPRSDLSYVRTTVPGTRWLRELVFYGAEYGMCYYETGEHGEKLYQIIVPEKRGRAGDIGLRVAPKDAALVGEILSARFMMRSFSGQPASVSLVCDSGGGERQVAFQGEATVSGPQWEECGFELVVDRAMAIDDWSVTIRCGEASQKIEITDFRLEKLTR